MTKEIIIRNIDNSLAAIKEIRDFNHKIFDLFQGESCNSLEATLCMLIDASWDMLEDVSIENMKDAKSMYIDFLYDCAYNSMDCVYVKPENDTILHRIVSGEDIYNIFTGQGTLWVPELAEV